MKSVIFFVHKGAAYYLNIAVAQARKTNPDADIILLGDKNNELVPGCNHYLIERYFKDAENFARIFVNYSPNPIEYELFCFQRWFIIREFQKNTPEYDECFLYCDSDTMLFDDVTSDIKNLGKSPLAIESEESPGFTFFNKGTLDEFCSLIMWLYSTAEGKKVIHKIHNSLVKIRATYGISDMTAFKYYCQHVHPGEVIAAEKPRYYLGGYSCYDHNVNISNNCRMKDGIKEFEWRNDQPFCFSNEVGDFVLFKGVHFQGIGKYQMIKFYYGNKLCKHPSLWIKLHVELPLKKFKRRVYKLLSRL